MQPEQQQRIMGYFIEEAKEHLNTIEQGLLNLHSTIEDPEMMNELFRAAHSVKGGAAMLGLNSIQRVSHRLEDFFKVLKDFRIKPDQKLESLFLHIFDALQELLGQLQGPYGLTDETATATLAGVEPTFEELEQHLNALSSGAVTLQPAVSETITPTPQPVPVSTSRRDDSALVLIFRSDVPTRLRDMLQLFKQPESDLTSRERLQEICRSLISIGDQFDLSNWCSLLETARQAIAHPDNTYRTLAPLVIKDIKQAQDLVLSGRVSEIKACAQLQELVPIAVVEPDIDEFADLLAATTDSDLELSSLDLIDSSLSFEDFEELQEIPAANFEASLDEDALIAQQNDHNGPEVGMAELNSLADLFEGEVPELGSTWQEEEVLNIAPEGLVLNTDDALGLDASSDFSDLLFGDSETSQTSEVTEDSLGDLFGDDLFEEDAEVDLSSQAESPLPSNIDVDGANGLDNPFGLSGSLDLDQFELDEAVNQSSLGFDNAFDDLDLNTSTNFSTDLSISENSGADTSTTAADGQLDDLGELFAGMNESDISLSSLQGNFEESAPLNFNDLEINDLEIALSDLSEVDTPSTSDALEALVNDPWDNTEETSPLSELNLDSIDESNQTVTDEFADLSVDDSASELFDSEVNVTDTIEELSNQDSDPDLSGLFEAIPSGQDAAEEVGLEELTDDAFDLSIDSWSFDSFSPETTDSQPELLDIDLAVPTDNEALEQAVSHTFVDAQEPEVPTQSYVPDPWDSAEHRVDIQLNENELNTADASSDFDFTADASDASLVVEPEELDDLFAEPLEIESTDIPGLSEDEIASPNAFDDLNLESTDILGLSENEIASPNDLDELDLFAEPLEIESTDIPGLSEDEIASPNAFDDLELTSFSSGTDFALGENELDLDLNELDINNAPAADAISAAETTDFNLDLNELDLSDSLGDGLNIGSNETDQDLDELLDLNLDSFDSLEDGLNVDNTATNQGLEELLNDELLAAPNSDQILDNELLNSSEPPNTWLEIETSEEVELVDSGEELLEIDFITAFGTADNELQDTSSPRSPETVSLDSSLFSESTDLFDIENLSLDVDNTAVSDVSNGLEAILGEVTPDSSSENLEDLLGIEITSNQELADTTSTETFDFGADLEFDEPAIFDVSPSSDTESQGSAERFEFDSTTSESLEFGEKLPELEAFESTGSSEELASLEGDFELDELLDFGEVETPNYSLSPEESSLNLDEIQFEISEPSISENNLELDGLDLGNELFESNELDTTDFLESSLGEAALDLSDNFVETAALEAAAGVQSEEPLAIEDELFGQELDTTNIADDASLTDNLGFDDTAASSIFDDPNNLEPLSEIEDEVALGLGEFSFDEPDFDQSLLSETAGELPIDTEFDLFSDSVSPASLGEIETNELNDLDINDLDVGEVGLNVSGDLTNLDNLLTEELELTVDSDFTSLDNLLSEEPPSNTGEFSDLAGLLDEEPIATENGEFPDLDNLLDASTSNQAELADLEDLLGEEIATDDFANLEGLLDGGVSNTPEVVGSLDSNHNLPSHSTLEVSSLTEDFADLEALLQGSTPESAPGLSTSQLTDTPTESEFDELDDLLKDAEEKMGGSPSVKVTRGIAPQNRRATRPGRVFSEQTMRVPVKHLDNLSNLVGELVVNRNSLEQDQERLRQSLDNLLYQVQQLSDVGQRMQDLYERSLLESSLLASRQSYRNPVPTTAIRDGSTHSQTTGSNQVEYDPLEMDRFTGFHSLSQEMIELIVRVRESASDIEFIVDETDQVTRMFRQVTTQLQEGLTRSRMVPFAQTADRLPRAVRDIAMKVGKQAELQVEGRETLIDKMILEQLYDPMTHLVNNAITHGIESPEVRRAAGKSPAGRITIRAFHQGNQTIISVSDDGAGIDVERVKAKALEKGLITPSEARSMSRLDVYDLLFHAGFSTKDQADDFAGRGVGMDVVRTSLSEIRGVITTNSTQGKGTTFTIRLPLTLSISKALCCISDRARIAFPMDGVEDMLDVPKERIQTNAEGEPCIPWRDSLLPLRPLSELLSYNRHLSRGNVYGGSQEDDIVSIVVLRSAGNFLALEVDQVLGEQEIVIKQLEGPVPKPVGVAGATVLGDGRIMPIADVLELIDLSMGRIRKDVGGSLWEQGGVTAVQEAPAAKTEPTVLIVDDSITVRELLSMTFNKVGYRVEQARDGQEAWEKLRAGLPCDIVFCDIEMPRMDGLELLSRIQKDPNLNTLPIAMLTSRGADRHRQMAASLGASGYFTKPYLEEALLDAAQRMLKGEVLISSGNAQPGS